MIFVSPIFLFVFFPIVFGMHYIIDKKYRNAFLALASFVFYAWGGLAYALLILVSTVVNYMLGRLVAPKEGRKSLNRKAYLVIAIVYNIGILAFFKYFNFIVDNIEMLIRVSNPGFVINEPLIPLPIGISFFTFQILSYVIDVYRGNVKQQKKYIDLALYIMLFPQLIAGPIVRYIDVEAQLSKRRITKEGLNEGVERFILGFAKKIIIANTMGQVADFFFNDLTRLSSPGAWCGVIAYALQIYFDFSAYSDMAIGLGRMFGFRFNENFNYPYISTSIQEFWRRWHISLSTWFRDYLYIPLGGSRKGTGRTYVNLCIVFFITGLWHGASWNFVIWGLFHGFFLVFERMWFKKVLEKIPKFIRWAYTMGVVLIGWVFFRAANLRESVVYLKEMFSFNFEYASRILLAVDQEVMVYFVIALIACYPIYPALAKKYAGKKTFNVLQAVFLVLIFVVSILYMTGSEFNPFIYFIF